MDEKKLYATVNTATVVGRKLLGISRITLVGALLAFGVSVLADRALVRLEQADYADV